MSIYILEIIVEECNKIFVHHSEFTIEEKPLIVEDFYFTINRVIYSTNFSDKQYEYLNVFFPLTEESIQDIDNYCTNIKYITIFSKYFLPIDILLKNQDVKDVFNLRERFDGSEHVHSSFE